jgi:CDP-6-deoxy-D-xylo-4-hexulose-3-dehydrase
MRQVDSVGVVYGEAEIAAATKVLRSGSLFLGQNVAELERRCAALMGKRHGVMVNSGSSALELAVELLSLPPGSEVVTPVLTFSTTVAPLIRAGLVPAFADVEPDTYNVDAEQVEALIGPRTRALVVPNLIGNLPDWDRLRALADRHGLAVLEDSCDTLGAKLGGRLTGLRSDVSVTSFALTHVITAAGNGGLLALDDDRLHDRALLLRRWGRSSEVRLFGSRREERGRFVEDVDGIEYDALYVFREIGHNFEPSEIGAAFGVAQLDRLEANAAARRRNKAAHDAFFARHPGAFAIPRERPGAETCWLQYPLLLRPGSGLTRTQVQLHLKQRGIGTRAVWTGNLLRQPGFRDVPAVRQPGGYPNADAVMRHAIALPVHHGLVDDDLAWIHAAFEELLATR